MSSSIDRLKQQARAAAATLNPTLNLNPTMKEEPIMSTNNIQNRIVAIAQAAKGMRTVRVAFPPRYDVSYPFKTFEDLAVDTQVVVETPRGLSIGQVVDMDMVPDVLRDDLELRWVVQTIDTTKLQALKAEEDHLASQLALTEAQAQLRRVVETLGVNITMPTLEGILTTTPTLLAGEAPKAPTRRRAPAKK